MTFSFADMSDSESLLIQDFQIIDFQIVDFIIDRVAIFLDKMNNTDLEYITLLIILNG